LRVRLLFFSLVSFCFAHDLPVDLTAQVWLKPNGGQMQVLVRVPLQAVRDVQFPEQADGFLDVEKLMPVLPGAAKVTLLDSIELYEDGLRLPAPLIQRTQISLVSDRAFETFAGALRRVQAAAPGNGDRLLWNQVFLDVWAAAPVRSERAAFAARLRFDHLANRVATSLRFELPEGVSRAYQWTTDPGVVALDPSWRQAASGFVWMGVEHILGGIDHLLFLLCLVIPVRRLRELIWVVTAFTVAHSLTLIASAYRWAPEALWFPPLIETLIAASILYMAIENIWRPAAVQDRWLMAFGFGLIHGFGFSFALHEQLQFAGAHLLVSLLSFNCGVELGQLAVLAVMVPLLHLLLRRVETARTGVIILSALVAHTSWHWMLERWERLAKFGVPEMNAALWAAGLRWLMASLLLAFVLWWLRSRRIR
jgi:hypothetical protein